MNRQYFQGSSQKLNTSFRVSVSLPHYLHSLGDAPSVRRYYVRHRSQSGTAGTSVHIGTP